MHTDKLPPDSNHIRHHNHETYVTVTEAARLATVPKSAIARWIRDGRLTAHRVGNDRRQWLKLDDIGAAQDSAATRTPRRPFNDADLATVMRTDLTPREAGIMLGRTIDVVRATRRYYADRIAA